ncbi:MAG: phage terminase large subunit family protein, partial [Thiobacillus sp.]|nr:phage terminase large subunit family protein [Thiobacillus sp.]
FLNGNVYKRWVKIEGERNEAWDLLVYNYAAAIRLGVNRWGEANWMECERILTQASLFAAPAGVVAEPDPYCRPPELTAGADAAAEVVAVAVRPLPVAPPVAVAARPVTPPPRRQMARSAYLR